MSIFGFAYSIFCAGALISDTLDNKFEDISQKSKAVNQGRDYYIDHKGTLRLTENNHMAYNDIVNGDRVMKDMKTNQIVRNYSEEQRQQKNIKARTEGKTVVRITDREAFSKKGYPTTLDYPLKGGLLYRDIITGKIMKEVEIALYIKPEFIKPVQRYKIYIDEDYNYVRPSDNDKNADKKEHFNFCKRIYMNKYVEYVKYNNYAHITVNEEDLLNE